MFVRTATTCVGAIAPVCPDVPGLEYCSGRPIWHVSLQRIPNGPTMSFYLERFADSDVCWQNFVVKMMARPARAATWMASPPSWRACRKCFVPQGC